MPAKIGSLGAPLDIRVRKGTTCGPFIGTITDLDGNPIDLTGCVVSGAIRHLRKDASKIVDFDCSILDAPNGKYQFGLTSEKTAIIPAGETLVDEDSIHQWDLEIQFTSGVTRPLYYGRVHTLEEATRT